MRFGRQRPPRDIAALALLFTGFAALAVAFWYYTDNWAGLLLPLGFLVGAFATLRTEVREIELRGDMLLLRTFFREYPIPRKHITKIVRTERGAAIDVLNGARYEIAPPDTDAEAVHRAAEAWLVGVNVQSATKSQPSDSES